MNNNRSKIMARVIGFYLLVLLSQIVAITLMTTLFISNGENSGTMTELTEFAMVYVLENSTTILLISNLFLLLSLFLLAKKGKQSFFAYTGLGAKTTGPILLLSAVCGIAANFWMSIVLNLMPLPTDLISSYVESSSTLISDNQVLDFIVVALLAPLMEELIFRGVIYKNLALLMPGGVVVVLQAMLFGGMHSGIIWMAYATVIGCVFGYIRYLSGSLKASVLAHIGFNAASYAFAYITTQQITQMTLIALLLASGFLTVVTVYGIRFRSLEQNKMPPNTKV